MEILREVTVNKGLALALGYFDGIHLGHRIILNSLIKLTKTEDIKTAVVTFDSNPADFFSESPIPAIQSFKDKELIIESMGVDFLYELDFSEYKDMTAEDYIRLVIVKNFSPKYIIVGFNHTFGKDKKGNAGLLQELSQKYGYECIVIPEQKYNDIERISSSNIRQYIATGNLSRVKAMLGRRLSIRNSVIKGSKMAGALGYPTANIIWPSSMARLPYGVYYGFCEINRKFYPSLINWGTSPTLSSGKNEILESHIYNFNENLYGKIIRVVFDSRIREQINFGTIYALKAQLKKDYAEFEKWAKLVSMP